MSITVDRKIATGMIGRGKTGDEMLAIVDMLIESFTKSTQPEPTLEEIKF